MTIHNGKAKSNQGQSPGCALHNARDAIDTRITLCNHRCLHICLMPREVRSNQSVSVRGFHAVWLTAWRQGLLMRSMALQDVGSARQFEELLCFRAKSLLVVHFLGTMDSTVHQMNVMAELAESISGFKHEEIFPRSFSAVKVFWTSDALISCGMLWF